MSSASYADLQKLAEGRQPDDLLFTTVSGAVLRNSNFRHYVFDRAVLRTVR
jgi:hypothetical protein